MYKYLLDKAFHLQTRHDSKISQNDSRTTRILSVLGMIFLPLSAVSSIFGSQFFSSIPAETNPDSGESQPESFHINRKFWILWAIAIPLTLSVITGWILWESWKIGRLPLIWKRRWSERSTSEENLLETGHNLMNRQEIDDSPAQQRSAVLS